MVVTTGKPPPGSQRAPPPSAIVRVTRFPAKLGTPEKSPPESGRVVISNSPSGEGYRTMDRFITKPPDPAVTSKVGGKIKGIVGTCALAALGGLCGAPSPVNSTESPASSATEASGA